MKANNEIRETAKQNGVRHWQIAMRLGVSEQTLVRWLRMPLSPDIEAKILGAIHEIATSSPVVR